MAQPVTINLVANEILVIGTPIEVTSEEPLNPRSAQAAIMLAGERTIVLLSDDGRKATVVSEDGGEHRPGGHVLVVNELLSENRERVAEGIRIPFLIIDTVAQIPSNVRLDTVVRVSVEELKIERLPVDRRPDRSFLEIFKAVDRTTGEGMDLAFDQDGKRIDANEVLAAIEKRRLGRFGKLEEALARRIEGAADDEEIPVSIWAPLESNAVMPDKDRDGPTRERPAAEMELDTEVERATERLIRHLERHGIGDVRPFGAAPMVEAEVSVAQLRELARSDQVGAVFLRDEEVVLDLGNSIAVARSDRAQLLGFDGTDINVAVWENGPDVVTNLDIERRFSTSPATRTHCRLTHAIIKNIEANRPHGHAPDCKLFSANTTGTDALRWALESAQACTVISQSFHRTSEAQNGTLQGDDVLKDWLVLRWPYPTIVQAAGNFYSGDIDNVNPPQYEYVNHKTFNCLVVGNHDDTAGALSGDSVFRNPASPTGDRELPDITANGTAVTAVGLTDSGTSFAAPAVAGCVALLQEADSVLQSWPEGCRAIVMAGATRTPGADTWFTDVQNGEDAAQGAGAIDALESLNITRSRRAPGAIGARRGWDVGTIRNADIGNRGETSYSYNVTVPTLMNPPSLKVALAWNSAVLTSSMTPLSSSLDNDLDLMIYDASDTLVGQSSSFDNSYEIAEFGCQPGSTLTIRIRRRAGMNNVSYGIAWSVR